MSIIDIILLIPLAYGLIRGLFRGFFKEIASVVGIVLGMWAARAFAPALADWFATLCDYAQTVLLPAAYLVIFLAVAVVLRVLAFCLEKLFSFAALGWLNKLAGAAFGLLKMWLILGVCVLLPQIIYRMNIVCPPCFFVFVRNMRTNLFDVLVLFEFESIVFSKVKSKTSANNTNRFIFSYFIRVRWHYLFSKKKRNLFCT